MKDELREALRADFVTFHARAFATLNPGNQLSGDYTDYLCQKITEFADGDLTRLLINMPPRHLKTFTASVCGSAWLLGHNPTLKILILTGSEELSDQISYDIRTILTSKWFKECFTNTRISKDRFATRRFATRQGGIVRSVPILGRFTGHGGDVVIVDDPHQINDARDVNSIGRVIEIFDTQVRSRLNRQARGRMMVIAHRIHQQDLSGHLLRDGEWAHVCLPLAAPKDAKVSSNWRREAGELLIPDLYSEIELKSMRAREGVPDFETLYQQDPSRGLCPIMPNDFRSYGNRDFSALPVVISIDPGHVGGVTNSFNVVQVWAKDHRHRLIDQYRAQIPYREFRRECRRLIKKYRPSAVIIEMTSNGPALSSELKLERATHLEKVHPSLSKEERLADHIETIRDGQISLPQNSEWRDDFIAEFVDFPNCKFTDQIDATTQYLSFMADKPNLKILPPRSNGALVLSNGICYSVFPEPHRAPVAGAGSPSKAGFGLALGSRVIR